MAVMSVTVMMTSPSPGSGRLVGVSCHTIWYLTVVGGFRVVRDWDWARVDMLRSYCGGSGMGKKKHTQIGG